MTTKPTQKRRWLWISLAVALTGALAACKLLNLTPPKDQDGNRPEDVARIFVKAVQAADFERAAACWRAGDVQNIEANSAMTFKEFCTYFFQCDIYELTPRGKDKNSHVVAFHGQKEGRPKTFGLFLQRVDGRWRLLMNRFIRDPEQGRTPKDTDHVIAA
jgi:hypothetical protein